MRLRLILPILAALGFSLHFAPGIPLGDHVRQTILIVAALFVENLTCTALSSLSVGVLDCPNFSVRKIYKIPLNKKLMNYEFYCHSLAGDTEGQLFNTRQNG